MHAGGSVSVLAADPVHPHARTPHVRVSNWQPPVCTTNRVHACEACVMRARVHGVGNWHQPPVCTTRRVRARWARTCPPIPLPIETQVQQLGPPPPPPHTHTQTLPSFQGMSACQQPPKLLAAVHISG